VKPSAAGQLLTTVTECLVTENIHLKRFLVVQNFKIAEHFLEAFRLTLIGRERQYEGTFSPDECQSKSFEKMNTLLCSYNFILHYI